MVSHNAVMTMQVTIDGAGRVVIPKRVRDQFRLEAGDTLELESNGDEMTLRPMPQAGAMILKDGWWVHQGKGSVSVEEIDELLREDREHMRGGGDR